MRSIYEATIVRDGKVIATDHADKAEAIATVEAAGEGRIVHFIRDFDGRDRSCALDVYEHGAWRGVDISR